MLLKAISYFLSIQHTFIIIILKSTFGFLFYFYLQPPFRSQTKGRHRQHIVVQATNLTLF